MFDSLEYCHLAIGEADPGPVISDLQPSGRQGRRLTLFEPQAKLNVPVIIQRAGTVRHNSLAVLKQLDLSPRQLRCT